MISYKSKIIVLLAFALGVGGSLLGQVVSPDDREDLLVRMQEVLNYPGERADVPEAPVQDFFFPSYLLEMGPTPLEILQFFVEDLEVAMSLQRQDGPVVRFTKSPELVQQGDEISFSHEGEIYQILVTNIQSHPDSVAFSFDLNGVELSLTLSR